MQAVLGDVVSAYAIEKLTMAKNQKVIVGVLSEKIIIAKTHFIPDIGYIHCFEGKCCEDHGMPAVRYGIHIAKYPTDGNITITGDDIEFLFMALGPRDYKNILTKDQILKQQGSALTKKDLLITCTDEQYQTKSFDVLGEAHWRKVLSKELYAERMALFLTSVESIFGRSVDAEMYSKLMNEASENQMVIDRQTIDQAKKSMLKPLPKLAKQLPKPAQKPMEGVDVKESEQGKVEASFDGVDELSESKDVSESTEVVEAVVIDDFDDLLD